MTRISRLLLASSIVFLPMSAFAEQPNMPAKTPQPTGIVETTPATGSHINSTEKGSVAKMDDQGKMGDQDMKMSKHTTNPHVHVAKGLKPHHVKAHTPAKTTEAGKS